MQGHVSVDPHHITLKAGDPGGRDAVHQVVRSWAGWRRLPAAGTLGGVRSSIYQARPWVSSIVPLFEQQTIDLTFGEGVEALLKFKVSRFEAARVELEPPPGHPANLKGSKEWARKPMAHQVRAIRALRDMDYRALLADDMGLGKSATAIWAWQQSSVPRALIICPATVKINWQREVWATLRSACCYVISGTAKQRADLFANVVHAMKDDEFRSAVIINYDLLQSLPENQADILEQWAAGQFLICDESHYIKNRKAKRTTFVMDRLAPAETGAKYRLCLTGTPIRNTQEDLWSQIQVVRPGIWSSFHQFDKSHLVRSHEEFHSTKGVKRRDHTVRGSKNVERLNAIVNTLQVRRAKEDVLDLPDKTFTYPEFELDPATRKIYRKMRDFAILELQELEDDTPIFAPGASSAMEATMRLEQIAQGFVGGVPEPYQESIGALVAKSAHAIPGRPKELMFPQSAKVQWLCETIDTILGQGGQPIIFSRFNAPMYWLVEQWDDAVMLHGGVPLEKRTAMIDDFQNKGKRVMFCQIRIAEGFNLTSSQDVIIYGRPWTPAEEKQAVDRAHRIGQKGTVNVQIPIVQKTFEIKLAAILQKKDLDARSALREMTIKELREAL